MPRLKRAEVHDSIREDIKATARRLLAAEGAAGMSLRAIARALDITAPALYTYFPSQDDLITALVVDGFTGLGDAMQAALEQQAGAAAAAGLHAAMQAYYAWALAHPAEYLLIYGTPIPGYTAPGDITVPAAVRIFILLVTPMEQALQRGELHPRPPYDRVPPAQALPLARLITANDYPVSPTAIYLGFRAWSLLYGLTMPALLGHLMPLETAAFFHDEVAAWLHSLGFSP
ncbi:MAG: WHG domain-containing protein [Anaerolineae bacterium]|nr:WHG domain-containing protein [Anaerolineae bacterium]